jgi:hypothetical protein
VARRGIEALVGGGRHARDRDGEVGNGHGPALCLYGARNAVSVASAFPSFRYVSSSAA